MGDLWVDFALPLVLVSFASFIIFNKCVSSFWTKGSIRNRNQTFTNDLGFSFSWTIPDFSASDLVELESPLVPYHSGKWSLVLRSKVINGTSSLGLYVKASGFKTPLEIKYQFSMVNVENERVCSFVGSGTLTPALAQIGTQEFINAEAVDVRSGLLVNGSATFLVEIVAVNPITENFVIPDFSHPLAPPKSKEPISGDETGTSSEPQGSEDDLRRDLSILLTTKELADLTFLTQGTYFFAHKAIVAARCPSISSQISAGSAEIVFDDIDPDVFSDVLTFIYTNKVDEDSLTDKGEMLIKAADALQLDKLKSQAEDAVLSSLNPSNAASLLVLAYECNCERLKQPILKMIKEHKKEVLATPTWKSLKNYPEILLDLSMFDILC